MNYVYLLRCADGSLYCGWTTDPVKRVRMHNLGKGAKYTRSRLPVELVYCEVHEERHAALSREWQIKRMNRSDKIALINQQEGNGIKQEATYCHICTDISEKKP